MIRALIDYLRLRKLGLTPTVACKNCIKPSFKIEMVIFTILIVAFFSALAKNAIADSELHTSTLKWQAIEAKLNAQASIDIANKLERAVLACLNGESIVIDGVDKPCKFGRYVNGREVF